MSETIINLEDEAVRAVTAQPSNAQLLTAIQGVARQVAAVQAAQMVIQQEIKTMSGTLQQQVDAITASLKTIEATLTTATSNIMAEIATLKAANPAVDFTALDAEVANLGTVASSVAAIAPAPAAVSPPAPPAAAP